MSDTQNDVLLVIRYVLSFFFLLAMIAIPIGIALWYYRSVREGSAGVGYVRLLSEVVERFVLAAEQLMATKAGQEKKKWVLDQAEAWCNRRKLPFDRELIEALLEAAVYAVINGPKGIKTEEIKTAIAVENAGGNPQSLPFVKGDAPAMDGPPPVVIENA